MKKVSLLLITIVLLFTSCSLGGTIVDRFFGITNSSRYPLSGNDRSKANARFDQILTACKNQDEVALKEMFSKKSIDEAEDMDGSIRALLDFFQGEMVSYDDWGVLGADAGKNDDGTGRNWKRLRSTYDVETSEQKYRFAIEEFTVDTADPDNVGIRSMYIIEAGNSDLEFAYWGDGKWTPGITIEKE